MKYHHGTRTRGGFTLIEVIVVIAIVATLAVLGWVATNHVRTSQQKEQAKIHISQLELAMTNYRQDHGDVMPTGKGDEWSAHVLYAALYCDENNDGEPDTDKNTGEQMVPYCEAIKPIATTKHMKEVANGILSTRIPLTPPHAKKAKKYYVILDPWGKPYRYRLGYELRDADNKVGNGINPDFDIFSLGVDGAGNGRTNTGNNEDNISNIRSWN